MPPYRSIARYFAVGVVTFLSGLGWIHPASDGTIDLITNIFIVGGTLFGACFWSWAEKLAKRYNLSIPALLQLIGKVLDPQGEPVTPDDVQALFASRAIPVLSVTSIATAVALK